MTSKHKTKLQIDLEKYIADINPMHLVIGTDTEYEPEVEMFLNAVHDSMNEDELINVVRQVFIKMFNIDDDSAFVESFKMIVREYLRLKE